MAFPFGRGVSGGGSQWSYQMTDATGGLAV